MKLATDHLEPFTPPHRPTRTMRRLEELRRNDRRPKDWRSEYGNWLDAFPWSIWATLTFRDRDPSPASALRSFHRWLSRCDLWFSCYPYFYVATEDGRSNGRTHLHALLGGLTCSHSRRNLWREWFDTYGRAEILPYDPGRGATHYLAKYVTKGLGEWEVGGDWPAAAGGRTPTARGSGR